MTRRPLSLVLLLFLVLALLTSCTPAKHTAVLYGKMNTDVFITLYGDGADKTAEELVSDCEALLDEMERTLSRTDAAAELAAVNASRETTVTLSDPLTEMLRRALSLAAETDGAFDPTAGALSVLYDITGNTPLPPDPAALAEARATVGYTALSLEGNILSRPVGTVLDLGAIAKGHAASVLVEYLLAEGVSGGILSLGGNVATFGSKPSGEPYRVAVRAPEGGYLGELSLSGVAFASTSGAYERFRVGSDGKPYHHIFDPKTGKPADAGLASVTVVSRDGARADALSTALYVMGYEEAIAFWEDSDRDFDMILVCEDGKTFVTPALAFEPA